LHRAAAANEQGILDHGPPVIVANPARITGICHADVPAGARVLTHRVPLEQAGRPRQETPRIDT